MGERSSSLLTYGMWVPGVVVLFVGPDAPQRSPPASGANMRERVLQEVAVGMVATAGGAYSFFTIVFLAVCGS